MKTIMKAYDSILNILDLPLKIWNLLLRKIGKKKIFSSNNEASDSESTDYSLFVLSAINNEKPFKTFRKNFYYRQILEHVNYELGSKYFNLLSSQSKKELLEHQELKSLSKVGSPRRYFFPELGFISPTMIRYQYVSQEFRRLFGDSIGDSIAEIGVGFGGQFAVLEKNFSFSTYSMFDLPQVIKLTNKVITAAGSPVDKIVECDIDAPNITACDLVISNYAFSELPIAIQDGYIKGVLSKAKRGYLIMNSGRTNHSGRSSGKYSLDQLRDLLPKFEVLEELPKTGPDNYVIVWGHN